MHGEAAVIVSRIRGIDRTLDRIERERTESIVRGMRSPATAQAIIRLGQDASDREHGRLLEERADLVRELRTLAAR